MHNKEDQEQKAMLRKQSFGISGIGSKITVTNIILVANAFVWYATILTVLESTIRSVGEESLLEPTYQILVWCIHFAGLIFSALIGATLAKRINRMKFLLVWMTLNVASSLTLFALSSTNPIIAVALVLLYGVSFGIGMPACMSNYSDSIPVENRGRVGGMVMLVSGISFFAFGVVPFNLLEIGIVLSIWRLSSLILFLIVKSSVRVELKRGADSFKLVISQRSFLAYYVPWVMFSFVNFLVPLQPTIVGETAEIGLLIQTVFLAIFAILGGFFLDFIGRKRIAITGFVMLGLSAAARGIDSTSLGSLYFSAIFEGTAWGLLLVLFLLTLWGDLSYSSPSDKYYALGVMPFFVSMLIGLTLGKQIVDKLPPTALFPFAAFFLFVAVLPLFYATETLPEKTMKDRDLKSYLEKAKKVAQKEAEKDQKQAKDKAEKEDKESTEEPQETPEDEEARKLAEKYY
jgi:MFS family permease